MFNRSNLSVNKLLRYSVNMSHISLTPTRIWILLHIKNVRPVDTRPQNQLVLFQSHSLTNLLSESMRLNHLYLLPSYDGPFVVHLKIKCKRKRFL